MYIIRIPFILSSALISVLVLCSLQVYSQTAQCPRLRVNLDDGWKFMRYPDGAQPDSLYYEDRPEVKKFNDNRVADTRAVLTEKQVSDKGIKRWILPTANLFIKDTSKWYKRPNGDPGSTFPFVQPQFDDSNWEHVDLPHDWAISQPFYTGPKSTVGGGMGRLPVQGVAWYRKKVNMDAADSGKSIFLDIDGAMSYAMVWCNGHLVGGWPYGYNSFRLDLTPFFHKGPDNILSIRLDNPNYSSRWYPGGGIYRDVWLVKVSPIHVAHWGSFVETKTISTKSADVSVSVKIENSLKEEAQINVVTEIFPYESRQAYSTKAVSMAPSRLISLKPGETTNIKTEATIKDPLLWGPPPGQQPNLYIAVTSLYNKGVKIDEYKTKFGIRSLMFEPQKGLMVNGTKVKIQGVNQHSDLGALGMAFNKRAAERQLEILKDMGCNAVRLAHNPPSPELLDLTDSMGFLVIDEIFDCWQKGKNPWDFHLIFKDWHEADIRSFIRRDRNHPSVIEWSFGNEVGEQYRDQDGARLAKRMREIVRDEDRSRPATASMNYAKPGMPFPGVMDVLSLNYQGEGIRDAPAYVSLKGIRTPPLYGAFQKSLPGKMIQSSESASALSSRGTFIFPVVKGISAPVSDTSGGEPNRQWVSAYGLYTAAFGSSPDKVFDAQDHHPFVAGEFVWSGFDYLGEPTPYYGARSSYSGMVDLAGFKKDCFYLYQSRWRPDLPMAHILPHWTWPDRKGKVTPVHVFTSGDEAELFLNGKSLGKKKKRPYEYRLRWDSVVYQPGVLKVVAFKNGKRWAEDSVVTSGTATKLVLQSDRDEIFGDGKDISFVNVSVVDAKGNIVPGADNLIRFEISGPAYIVATDNGDPADLRSFSSHERNAFSGLALAMVKAKDTHKGEFILTAKSNGLVSARIVINIKGHK